ncbi:hypothetical protein INT46_000365 [Mucor plumbeus]|uniref:CCHC-type domain-containing protein n=1 Tax=Mucor plumbeus TaxID=97098 RepID=A0A8H7VIA9_9FUNG|nr:hypothetical protein INT46_000365 [Mucor plumbeus]
MTTSDITQNNPETPGTIKTNLGFSHRSNEKLPRYREGDNLQIFLKLYEKTATLNGWSTHQAKLEHIHNSFKGKLQEWVVSQTWEDWDEFKGSLLEREEVVIKDDMHYLNKLLNTKRKNYISLNKFIIKFDNLMQERRNAQTRSSITIDDESFYMKLFIKNSSPADMRRYLKEKKGNKLVELYKVARMYEDEDSSDEDDSDCSSNSSESYNDSESDSDNSNRRSQRKSRKIKPKHSMVKTNAPKIVKNKEPTFKAALLTMIENQQTQLLLLQQQQQQTQTQNVNPIQMTTPQSTIFQIKRCYNCKEPGHFDDNCPQPCKYCGSRDHKRYQCPQKPSRPNNHSNGNGSTAVPSSGLFMHISDTDLALQQSLCYNRDGDLFAMKRLRSETQKEKEDKTAKKAKYKANREAKRIAKLQELINNNSKNSIGSSRIVDPSSSSAWAPTSIVDNQSTSDYVPTQASCDTSPITVDPPVTTNDPMHVNENSVMSPPVVPSSQAELHPVLQDPLKVKPPIFESRTSTVIAELRNQKVFNLSYNELIALSSKAHTEFRRPLVSKTQLENDGVKDISDLLLNQEVELPEGNHAPRTIGQLNGVKVNVILDTGCTPCVISYHLVQKLGLADKMISLPKSSNGGILVGDGRRVQTKGIVKNLELQLLPGHTRPIDAVCLDVPDSAYEFLCGRIVMAQFGICVDLGTSLWFIRNGKELDEMEVLHTAPDVDQGTDTCYLVNVQSVQAVQSVQSETTSVQENAKSSGLEMFDKLFADIDSNPLLSKKQQLEIKQLILSKSKAFGIDPMEI